METVVIFMSVFLLVKNTDAAKRKFPKPINHGVVFVVALAVALLERAVLSEEPRMALNTPLLMIIASFVLFHILTGIARALDASCRTARNTTMLAAQIPGIVDDGEGE